MGLVDDDWVGTQSGGDRGVVRWQFGSLGGRLSALGCGDTSLELEWLSQLLAWLPSTSGIFVFALLLGLAIASDWFLKYEKKNYEKRTTSFGSFPQTTANWY